MIRETEYFDSEVEANKNGELFVKNWGYAYAAKYSVWYSQGRGQWACETSRYSSCD